MICIKQSTSSFQHQYSSVAPMLCHQNDFIVLYISKSEILGFCFSFHMQCIYAETLFIHGFTHTQHAQ